MCVPASRQCVLRCEKTHTCKAPTLSSRKQTRVKRPVATHHSVCLSRGKASPKRKGSPARPGWGLHADEETNKSASKNMQTPRFRLQTTHHACPHAGQYVLQALLHITHDFLATFSTCCPTDPIPKELGVLSNLSSQHLNRNQLAGTSISGGRASTGFSEASEKKCCANA